MLWDLIDFGDLVSWYLPMTWCRTRVAIDELKTIIADVEVALHNLPSGTPPTRPGEREPWRDTSRVISQIRTSLHREFSDMFGQNNRDQKLDDLLLELKSKIVTRNEEWPDIST